MYEKRTFWKQNNNKKEEILWNPSNELLSFSLLEAGDYHLIEKSGNKCPNLEELECRETEK